MFEGPVFKTTEGTTYCYCLGVCAAKIYMPKIQY